MSGVHQVLATVFLLTVAVRAQPGDQTIPVRIDPVVVTGATNGVGSCPSSDTLDSARSNTSAAISTAIQLAFQTSPCGGLGWRQVANLDMDVASQQCPSPWVEISNPSRSCTSSITTAGCEGISLPVSGAPYSRVCGRAFGYAVRSPDAFFLSSGNINSVYIDGISVTHGLPRQHIWSFAAGYPYGYVARCPCDNTDRTQAPLPPSFVGDNYFCDGNNNGAIWDAVGCNSNCCTFNSPPWFNVSLPTPTSDDFEVRICTDQRMSEEAVHLYLLQLFVQ